MTGSETAFVVSAGCGVLASVLLIAFSLRRAGVTLLLATLAHASMVQHLIGTKWHQHFPWTDGLLGPDLQYQVLIALDVLWVAGAGASLWRAHAKAVVQTLLTPRGLLVIALFVSSAGLAMPHVAGGQWLFFAENLVLGSGFMALGALNVVLFGVHVAASGAPAGRRLRELGIAFIDGRAVSWVCAGFVFVVSSYIALVVYEGIPQIPDTVSTYWHARYFALGRLTIDAPPVPEAFHQYLITYVGAKQYAHTSPVSPITIAIGMALGIPWAVNPAIAAATIPVQHRLIRKIYGLRAANISVVLVAVSPWFLFMSGTYQIHPVSLLVVMVALVFALEVVERGTMRWALATGAALGVMLATRSFEAVLSGVFIFGWLALRAPAPRWKLLAGLSVASVAVGVWNLVYNHVVTGSWSTVPTTSGVATEWDVTKNKLGFGADRGFGWSNVDPRPGHDFFDVLLNTNHNFYWLQFETFGWACGSLIVILVGIVCLRRWERGDRLFLGLILSVAAAYSLYWFSGGPDYGGRYWYLTIPAVTGLTASWLSRGGAPWRGFALAAAIFVGFVVVMPWRALDKYPRRRGMQDTPAQLEQTHDWSNALVFVKARYRGDYASVFIRNPIDLEDAVGQPIYVLHLDDATNTRVRAAFPDRNVWVITGTEDPGVGYVLLARPSATSTTSH